mgnify:CR=1 FL=1
MFYFFEQRIGFNSIAGPKVEKHIVHQIAQYGGGNQKLIGSQKSIPGKMEERQYMKTEGDIDKNLAELGDRSMSNLGFNRRLNPGNQGRNDAAE